MTATTTRSSTTASSRTALFSLGGRRFVLTVGAGIVYTALLICGHLDATAYVTLQVATVAAYIAANTAQKIRAKEADA